MKKIFLILVLLFLSISLFSQNKNRQNINESTWDQGVPVLPEDNYIMGLIEQLGDSIAEWDHVTSKSKAKICREVGLAFYNRGIYDAADWYLTKAKNYKEEVKIESAKPKPTSSDIESMKADQKFLENLPKSYDNISRKDMKKIVKEIENKIKELIRQRDSLLSDTNVSQEVVDAKNNVIGSLNKEKDIIDLNIQKSELKDRNKILFIDKENYKKYLIWISIFSVILGLGILALLQRKTIKVKDDEINKQLEDIGKKNTYLEHAARIIRHDMHSGINTYMPRGINSLEKRLSSDDIKNLKIEGSIKMIKEGLEHTQKVYKSVYEFTNLVKRDVVLNKTKFDLKEILIKYLNNTSYSSQVNIEYLGESEVNEPLFCTALDNFIKNGLKYNVSENKLVKIYLEKNYLVIEDNGKGMTQKQFEKYSKPKNFESGLGISISVAILEEHGFPVSCEKNNIGTKMKIKIK